MATAGGAGPTGDQSRPSTSGNANAKKCLEDLFERIEATVKKRVRVKLGGAKTIDWNKLSVTFNAATAKSKPPILPSSRTWRTDLAVEMKPEIKQQLREVFIRYCGWGDKHNFMFISRAQFIRFVRDMGMCNDEIDAMGLSGLFDKILLGSLDPGAASRLALSDFVLAVTGLGTKLCPAPTVQESFDLLVSKYILPRLQQPLYEPEPIDLALLHMDIMTTLERLRPKLAVLWDAYMQQQAISGPHDTPGSSASGSANTDNKVPEMTLSTFLRLTSDFEITVVLLSKLQLILAFKRSKFGVPPDAIDANPHTKIRTTFQEFLDCIARCAMVAFDYKPPPVVVPTLDFKDSYRTAAKQLWLQQVSGGNGLGMGGDDDQSEVEMPAAVNYTAGNEDCAHYDEWTSRAPSVRISNSAGATLNRDRLISRAVSIAQGRTPMRHSDVLEVMAIHDEPSTMQPDVNKPLHLKNFSCDWVGRPGLTLGESGNLRPRTVDPWIAAGLYHTQRGVDQTYEQRAKEMLAARVVREQHMEALQRQYQVDRREQIRDATRQAAVRRQDLELQAGQTLARVMSSAGASSSKSPETSPGQRGDGRQAGSGKGAGRAGSVSPGGGAVAKDGIGRGEVPGDASSWNCGTRVVGLEEVLNRTGIHGAGAAAAARSRTLLEELTSTLDVESKLPRASIAGHGQIRFGYAGAE